MTSRRRRDPPRWPVSLSVWLGTVPTTVRTEARERSVEASQGRSRGDDNKIDCCDEAHKYDYGEK